LLLLFALFCFPVAALLAPQRNQLPHAKAEDDANDQKRFQPNKEL